MTTIRILHLSDLHFGEYNRFAGRDPRKLGKAFAVDLAEARRQMVDGDGPVDLVIVTGDIAERGKPAEFEAGQQFLEAVSGGLGVLPRRFVFVPGNHDISRPQCAIIEELQKEEGFDDAELRRRIDEVKLKHYDAFVHRFYSVKDLREIASRLDRGGWLYSFPELRLSVGALSSCEREDHKEHVGSLSSEQAQNLMDAWRDGKAREWVKVVAVHHNPDLTTSNNLAWWIGHLKKKGLPDRSVVEAYFSDICGFQGAEFLKRVVADSQVQLVLHGHHHAGDEKIWRWRSPGLGHVLSAGSMGLSQGKLPTEEPLSCRFVRLDLDATKLDARRLIFTAWAASLGDVEQGAFTLDPAEPEGYRQRLELPPGFQPTAALRPFKQPAAGNNLADFLRVYRQRMSHAFSSWVLSGVSQPAASGRPLEGRLDDMYVELRFFKDLDPSKTELGKPIGVSQLRRRKKPLLIRGAAGTGKTTWMQRTFRRLLAEPNLVPVMLVLRDLSRQWQGPRQRGVERSLDAFLDEWVAEHLGNGWAGRVGDLLRLENGPRPVLLVDGWDEIGELGDEVRRKLVGLMQELPQLLVIVTSRPYGKSKPSHAEGFESLEVQPLSDADMKEFSRRFFKLCNPQDDVSASREVEGFERAFAAAPEARSLARTPLFLTMMLMIGRAKPLPDKRHLLYEACVENLLHALPEKRTRGGALILDDQWRPEDVQERLRIVARLAFEVQREGYTQSGRGAIVRKAQELMTVLPAAWTERDRGRFLAWLAGPAGLLTDRTDGSFQFSHLSFQEYLAAWHLDSTRESSGRRATFLEMGKTIEWWETLQLWAALIDRRNPVLLHDVLISLLDAEWDGYSLAGMILADGSASQSLFETWCGLLSGVLKKDWPSEGWRCVRAWRTSAQDSRRLAIRIKLCDEKEQSWLSWHRCAAFLRACGEPAPRLPELKIVSRAAIEQETPHLLKRWTAAHFAASRLLTVRLPLWPHGPSLAGFLNLWPNRRRWLGARLQSLAVFCPARSLSQFATRIWPASFWNSKTLQLAKAIARLYAPGPHAETAADRCLTIDRALYTASGMNTSLAAKWTHRRVGTAKFYLFGDVEAQLGHFPRDFQEIACSVTSDSAAEFIGDLKISSTTPGFFDLAKIEEAGSGRCGARFVLARNDPDEQRSAGHLFGYATQLSCHSTGNRINFLRTLAEIGPSLHEIWSSLAKHVAGISTAEDRTLLLDYAKHPEKAGEPLCWGLQFIVRGDVMREDGSIVTLDEISDAAGLEPLPLLEDMPPELEF